MDKTINIALLGYGKMGQLIENIAGDKNINVITHFDENNLLEDTPEIRRRIKDVSVFVDFTVPSAVLQNTKTAAAMGKNLVIGTTGWHDHLTEVKKIVKEDNIGLVYGSNFSLGVNLFYKISDYAAQLFSAFDNYDPYIEESHHKMKKDAPSGTALVIKDMVQKQYPDQDLPVSSTRAGYIPGIHSLNFDSVVDSVHIKHIARSRMGLAEGAILAVKWIHGKKGVFAFQNVLDEIIT
ncbi:MAG: 4-hydroxy-tetrahydrodipicolinate reductase [Calditrichaceae bacterium]|jgi:4-hydroxy-tetrahydrodipicolinate reductase